MFLELSKFDLSADRQAYCPRQVSTLAKQAERPSEVSMPERGGVRVKAPLCSLSDTMIYHSVSYLRGIATSGAPAAYDATWYG